MTDVMFSGIGIAAAFLLAFVLARQASLASFDPPSMLTILVKSAATRDGRAIDPEAIGLGYIVVAPSVLLSSDSATTVQGGFSLETTGSVPGRNTAAFAWATSEAVLEMTRVPQASARLLVFVAMSNATADRERVPVETADLERVTVEMRAGGVARQIELERSGGFAKVVALKPVFERRLPDLVPMDWWNSACIDRTGSAPLGRGRYWTEDDVFQRTGRTSNIPNIPEKVWYVNAGDEVAEIQQRGYETAVSKRDDESPGAPLLGVAATSRGSGPAQPEYPSLFFVHSLLDVSAVLDESDFIKFFGASGSQNPLLYRARLDLSRAGFSEDADLITPIEPIIRAMAAACFRDVRGASPLAMQACRESWSLVTPHTARLLVAHRSDEVPEVTTGTHISFHDQANNNISLIDVATDPYAVDDVKLCELASSNPTGVLPADEGQPLAIGASELLVGIGNQRWAIYSLRNLHSPKSIVSINAPVDPGDGRVAPWLFGGGSGAYLRPVGISTLWRGTSSVDLDLPTRGELAPLVVFSDRALAALRVRQDPRLWLRRE